MLPTLLHPSNTSSQITLVMMPFLGGSQREWTETIAALHGQFDCITADLPGFGDAANLPGYSVEEMRAALIDTLAALDLKRYALVGHSMAGKVSAVVARALVEDQSRVKPPSFLVLVAPSPPGPEPMTDEKRSQMLTSLGTVSLHPTEDRTHAEKFIQDNLAGTLPFVIFDRTVDDVLRMNRSAWIAWLESGSKEDWSAQVGVLHIPTLIVAGGGDQALGPEPQRRFTAPHFSSVQVEVVESSHLVPLEQPDKLAVLIQHFLDSH